MKITFSELRRRNWGSAKLNKSWAIKQQYNTLKDADKWTLNYLATIDNSNVIKQSLFIICTLILILVFFIITNCNIL